MSVKVVSVSNVLKPFPNAVVTVEWGDNSRDSIDCTGWFYEPTIGDVVWIDMDTVPGQPHLRRIYQAARTPNLTSLTVKVVDSTPSGMRAATSTYVPPVGAPLDNLTFVVAPTEPSTVGSATYSPVASHTWDPTNNWGLGDSKCRQGAYPGVGPSKGLWFYGAGAFANLAGHTLTSITVTIQRDDRTGSPYAPKAIYVVGHGYATQPTGEPAVTAAVSPGSLGTNDVLTFNLPLSFATALQSGATAGLGVASAAQGDYLAVLGAGSGSGTITIGWSS